MIILLKNIEDFCFLSLSQNPVGFGERLEPWALEKAVLRPLFPAKSKVTFPKLKFWESFPLL
jgi:hypothetical protein